MKSILNSAILILVLLISPAYAANDTCSSTDTQFNVGAGIYDITGPAAEQRMMGYAMINQATAGIYQRLWARAFIIESPCNGKRVVFVNADLGQLFQGIKQQVIAKLQKKYGNRYTDDNVLLTAVHTHSGPGGYSTYIFYNLTILGFSRSYFDTIIDGIVAAIERAQLNMQPAQIKVATGQLYGVGFNRSPSAYLLNPPAERNRYTADVDTEMTLIRFDALDGKPIGMINWFPVHGTSMNNKNFLINGDNKGYAEYLFEKDFHSDQGSAAFVAAFAQANAGDVSPNDNQEGGTGMAGILAVEKAGQPQYQTAKTLYNNASELITGAVDYRHTYLPMGHVNVEPPYTDGRSHYTCPAAIGVSMLAGTQDGLGYGYQGASCADISKVIPKFVCEMVTTVCQGAKPIVITTADTLPRPWTPQILPLQVIKVGNLVIGAYPFELTTMTGRRLHDTIAKELPPNTSNHIVLSALANAYAGYVATQEEYQLQRYEGASTHFGPWTAAALQQETAKLTKALLTNTPVEAGPLPPDYSSDHINMQPGVIYDSTPSGKQFGDIYQDVKPHYQPGEPVTAIFWGAHPKNNYRIQDTFLEIQHLENGQWTTIRRDNDWDTEYHWERNFISYSHVTIVWRTSSNSPRGQYRIIHHGDWKSFWTQKITPYTGYSSIFTID